MIFSRTDDPILVAAPTELVARPAMMRGAARPPVVRVRIPPAMVRLPPTTFAPVPTVRVILHLSERKRGGNDGAERRTKPKHAIAAHQNINERIPKSRAWARERARPRLREPRLPTGPRNEERVQTT